jgi:hypothetical protein
MHVAKGNILADDDLRRDGLLRSVFLALSERKKGRRVVDRANKSLDGYVQAIINGTYRPKKEELPLAFLLCVLKHAYEDSHTERLLEVERDLAAVGDRIFCLLSWESSDEDRGVYPFNSLAKEGRSREMISDTYLQYGVTALFGLSEEGGRFGFFFGDKWELLIPARSWVTCEISDDRCGKLSFKWDGEGSVGPISLVMPDLSFSEDRQAASLHTFIRSTVLLEESREKPCLGMREGYAWLVGLDRIRTFLQESFGWHLDKPLTGHSKRIDGKHQEVDPPEFLAELFGVAG